MPWHRFFLQLVSTGSLCIMFHSWLLASTSFYQPLYYWCPGYMPGSRLHFSTLPPSNPIRFSSAGVRCGFESRCKRTLWSMPHFTNGVDWSGINITCTRLRFGCHVYVRPQLWCFFCFTCIAACCDMKTGSPIWLTKVCLAFCKINTDWMDTASF